jgi:hypothetical protein
MRNARVILTISYGIALAAACSSSSPNAAGGDGGGDSTAATPMVDSSGGAASEAGGDDGGLLGTPTSMTPDATITCMGAMDCGGAGHACCFSTSTFSTMCVTGTCGSNYTQCVSMDSECPAGLQCLPSPLGMTIHYCAPGDGGVIEGGSGDASGDAGVDAHGDGGAAEASTAEASLGGG